MKTLDTEFKREGNEYRQIWREKDITVFEYGPKPRYELVIIHVRPEHFGPRGNVITEREAYPATSQWGQYGWTLGPEDRELAIHIGKQIVDLPATQRIPRIHAIMDRWITTRKELQSVNPTASVSRPSAFGEETRS